MVTVLPMGKVGREAMAYHHASYGRCASVRRVPVLMTPGKWSVGSTLLRRSHCCAVVRRAAVSCCVVHMQVRVVEMFHHEEPWSQPDIQGAFFWTSTKSLGWLLVDWKRFAFEQSHIIFTLRRHGCLFCDSTNISL